MAACHLCRLDMLAVRGCTGTHIRYEDHGERLSRIRMGDAREGWIEVGMELEPGERCHDCNAEVGFFHHPGCDMERCPRCGHQLITCDCGEMTAYVERGILIYVDVLLVDGGTGAGEGDTT